jgi:ribose 5-phosphate isomerase A
MSDIGLFKKRAAEAAVQTLQPGMVVGLGTGSTARHAIERIARLISDKVLCNIVCVPSSAATEKLARALEIPLTDLEKNPDIDINIDGADEVDPDFNLIKGGGGALLREKILAQTSKRNIIIVDETKLSPKLGTRFFLPVEVLEFAWRPEQQYLRGLGADVQLRKTKLGAPFKTDSGNVVLDANFGPMGNPGELAARLDSRAGVMGHGLFLGLVAEIFVGGESGVRRLVRGQDKAC